ncbi:MAG: ABC transporter ATP-binding protein [Thermoleophilia bacterium]
MLKVSNLIKEFKSDGGAVTAVNDVSLTVDDGRFVAFVGESGSGKSTLLSLLGALAKPTAGAIDVDGEVITSMSDAKLIAYRRDSIGFVFQNYSLVPNLSALENVMLPMEFAGMSRTDRRQRAAQLLEQVGLDSEKQLRKPGRLSGGEQQRVGIARALANKPRMILADEPTGNLDSKTGEKIITLLSNLAKSEHVTVLAVTHDLSIEKQCDEIFRIRDGVLV